MADEDIEDILKVVAKSVYEKVTHHGMNDRTYEKAMSQELSDRDIIHETHKKVYDERKGKYKFIDLYLPDNGKFVTLKARKYITRAELNELKDNEIATGLDGIIINFYNGVSFRHSTSGKTHEQGDNESLVTLQSPTHHRNHKSRMTLPHLSGSTGRLSDISPPLFRPNKIGYNGYSKSSISVMPLDGERDLQKNACKIFSISCAAFFLSEGNRKEFASIFNDLLVAMKFERIHIPERFLKGPKMKSSDGELAEILRKTLNSRRRTKKNQQNGMASKNNSNSEGSEQEIYYVGFEDKEE